MLEYSKLLTQFKPISFNGKTHIFNSIIFRSLKVAYYNYNHFPIRSNYILIVKIDVVHRLYGISNFGLRSFAIIGYSYTLNAVRCTS